MSSACFDRRAAPQRKKYVSEVKDACSQLEEGFHAADQCTQKDKGDKQPHREGRP